MKAIIITEDSNSQLPEIRRWKATLGKGEYIENNLEISSRLEAHGYPKPAWNLDCETNYREVLSDFIRPAESMFGGSFQEVKAFKDELNRSIPTDLFIVSGRYGLLPANATIIPYHSSIESGKDLASLDCVSGVSTKIKEVANSSDIIIIALPSFYIRYFLSTGLFQELHPKKPIIIVGAPRLQEELPNGLNIDFFPRKGVARLSKKNRDCIITLVQQLNNSKLEDSK